MSREQEVLLSLTGLVKCESGQHMLDRGDPVPDDILPEEADRLRGLGAIGVPSKTVEAESGDDADVLSAEALEEWVHSDATVDQVVEAAVTAEKALELLEYEESGKARGTAIKRLTEIAESGDDA